jgi:hypothetical protein
VWQAQEQLERAEREMLFLVGFAVAPYVPEDRVWQLMRGVDETTRTTLVPFVSRWLVQSTVSTASSSDNSVDDIAWAVVAVALVDSASSDLSHLTSLWPSLGPAPPPLTETVSAVAAQMWERWHAVDQSVAASIRVIAGIS